MSQSRFSLVMILALPFVLAFCPTESSAQFVAPKTPPSTVDTPDTAEGIARSKQNVAVPDSKSDRQIANRLKRIFEATGWFTNAQVESREGIVTLKGQVAQKSQREWAEGLAHDTEGVIAVINSIEVPPGQWFDLRPAEQETKTLIKKFFSFTPYLLASIVILIVVAGLAMIAMRIGRRAAQRRIRNSLLIEITAKAFALPVVLIGLYLVLRVSGLSGVAVTILGGTGALGLVAGFAMKNILENYFSGVMLSISNPYSVGDIITVNGKTGVVQTLTTRGTVLVDFDGNHIIIPNSTIYGTTVVNETANPSIRVKFSVAINSDESPSKVRETILRAVREAKGVLEKPESLVLASAFENAAIIYDVYFWIDTQKSSSMKMKSLVIELVRARLCEAKIKIQSPRREVVVADPNASAVAWNSNESFAESHASAQKTETSVESGGLLEEASKGRGIQHGEKLL